MNTEHEMSGAEGTEGTEGTKHRKRALPRAARPWVLEGLWPTGAGAMGWEGWKRWGRYASRERAEQAREQMLKGWWKKCEWRVRCEGAEGGVTVVTVV